MTAYKAEPEAEPTNLGWIVQRREDDPNNPGWWRYGRPTWESTDMSWCPGSRWSWGTPSDLTTAQTTWDASH
ncbi:MAG: hypothetical protein ACO3GP_07540 [Candidatus Limnocylindrus sp.]